MMNLDLNCCIESLERRHIDYQVYVKDDLGFPICLSELIMAYECNDCSLFNYLDFSGKLITSPIDLVVLLRSGSVFPDLLVMEDFAYLSNDYCEIIARFK